MWIAWRGGRKGGGEGWRLIYGFTLLYITVALGDSSATSLAVYVPHPFLYLFLFDVPATLAVKIGGYTPKGGGGEGCAPGFPAGLAPERSNLLFWASGCSGGRKEGQCAIGGWPGMLGDGMPK